LAFVCFMHLCVHQGDLCSYSLSSFPSLFLADFFCSFKTQFHISCSRSVPGAFLSGSNALYCDFFFFSPCTHNLPQCTGLLHFFCV
jgi:hypothetical protein